MRAVLEVVESVQSRLPDKAKLAAWVAEVRSLVNDEKAARARSREFEAQRQATTRRMDQLKRLLFDQMRRISKLGLAAYPGDLKRQIAYGLDRFVGKRRKAGEPSNEETPDETEPAPA